MFFLFSNKDQTLYQVRPQTIISTWKKGEEIKIKGLFTNNFFFEKQ